MTPNHFDSDLDEIFAPGTEHERMWAWANAAFWASMLALLLVFWGWVFA